MGDETIDYKATIHRIRGEEIQERALEVKKLLHSMDIPAFRRDASRPANVRWLIRNLAARNNKRASFKTVIRELVLLDKAFRMWENA